MGGAVIGGGNFSIENCPCNVDDATNQGVCVNSETCKGDFCRVVGNCGVYGAVGAGFDCCKTLIPCGGAMEKITKIAYFQNPGFPHTEKKPLSCNVNVKVAENVCQLRLDFIDFELPVPDKKSGKCPNKNSMTFLADSVPLGIFGKGSSSLCGLNSGQHLYIPVQPRETVKILTTLQGHGNPSPGQLNIGSSSYRWNIMVTQIDCGTPLNPDRNDQLIKIFKGQFTGLRAPTGCLQYFTGKYDKLSSFNFDGHTYVPPNQDYTICVRPDMGMASGLTIRATTFKMPTTGVCSDGVKIVDDKEQVCCINTPNSGYIAYTGWQKFGQHEALRRYWCGENLGPEQFMSGSSWNIRIVTTDNWECEYDPVGFNMEYKVDIGI